MNEITIQPINSAHVGELQKIAIETFVQTFGAVNLKENIDHYLSMSLTRDQLLKEINNKDSDFFFLYYNDTLAGYLKLNTGDAQTELQDSQALEIERIYVLEQYQGKKFGKALLEYALSVARQRKSPYVWLGVWERNNKAITFYEKAGFYAFSDHHFTLGNELQRDILLKKDLL